jgi:hypothetical protein
MSGRRFPTALPSGLEGVGIGELGANIGRNISVGFLDKNDTGG